ncbi:subtilase family protein [Pseudoduganella lurida]|uniref:Subtilase family protein n=1 Tax=Pseudoduganella lurida TaxID=1036180 RepID=A0A562RBJ6_9BURK|nr:S8 family serine peptidase [Pseudoduganella lurida]TWI66431.1 subtilase family protein [Pseudoduganella lurida]
MSIYPKMMAHATGAPLVLDSGRILLALKAPRERTDVEQFLRSQDMYLEDEPEGGNDGDRIPGERVNHTKTRFWAQSRRPLDDERLRKIEQAGGPIGLDFLGPVYRMAGQEGRRALMAPLPNVGVIRLRDNHDPDNGRVPLADVLRRDNQPAPVLREIPEKSKYLNGFRYYQITNAREVNAYELRDRVRQAPNGALLDFQFETMPLLTPTSIAPNDTLFPQQWDMTRIEAGGPGTTGWDITTGVATVVVCVLDEGCDLTHPDLRFADPGINLGTMVPDGSPTGNHGTACAGIVAATYDNGTGVTGVAGNSRILPVAFDAWTDVEVAAGINYASANGASIISMSFGWNAWSPAIIDPAIQNAFNNDVVMCVATHNYNGPITYPATNPLVIAVGASDEIDNRKTPLSPDGEPWGSNFGPEISVVAPGVHIPTTDIQGAGGYDAGDYDLVFNGTSSATPHVAGLAALIRSAYPTLTNVQVRAHIERTAQKVGAVAYADTVGRPNGSWNQETGYGRINVYRALDEADVMIRDAPADNGNEPYTGGNFWDFSDIVVRITDDGVFQPGDPLQSKNVERGQANYIYVRVTNTGSREARNVTIGTRITPYVGTQFIYPQDWTLTDATHVAPTGITTSFGTLAPGASALAKFRIEAAQTETLYGWVANNGWHGCLMAVVNADNDYAFATAPLTGDPITARRNNLAQRNLSVIDVLANSPAVFHFIAGNRFNLESRMTLQVDRSRLPAGMGVTLSLDEPGIAFPAIDFEGQVEPGETTENAACDGLEFLSETKIKTRFGCCNGILTLGKGSRFDCKRKHELRNISVQGGDVVVRNGQRFVDIKQPLVSITMEKAPGIVYPLAVRTTIPGTATAGQQFMLGVAQQNSQGMNVGGAGMVYVVR